MHKLKRNAEESWENIPGCGKQEKLEKSKMKKRKYTIINTSIISANLAKSKQNRMDNQEHYRRVLSPEMKEN